ncbi:cytochrome P450 [Streptomyces sp. NPDC020800]|uniref:cytochrome P450 n=1 Tax=Streptomyces sp. NPDC020800 TaxID=3365092 RepID=UPI0037A931A7
MTEKPDADIPSFPMSRPGPFELPAEYARMLEHCPVRRARLANDTPVWLISRYEDIRAALTDPRVRADRSAAGFPFLNAETTHLRQVRVFFGMDSPDHGPERHMYQTEFTAQRVEAMRPFLQHCTDERVDRLIAAGPPADVVRALAYPIPTLAVARVLGVPESDYDEFERIATATMIKRDESHFAALFAYMREFVDYRGRVPGNDLTSRVLRTHVKRGSISTQDVLHTIFMIMTAGIETTAGLVSLGIATLLQHPDQLAELRADPALMDGAVDELLRYLSVGELASVRIAGEDLTMRGVHIRAGEGIVALGAAGNRDPRAYPDPDTFDIHRDARRHLAFGHGPHKCIGRRLARLELDIIFSTLIARLPELRLAGAITDDLLDNEALVFGLHALDVTWRDGKQA